MTTGMGEAGRDGPVAAVVYRYVPQYRREFYELLRHDLAERGVRFRLLHGEPGPEDEAKHDAVELPWAERIANRVVPVAGRTIYWQPCLGRLRGVDLVVLEQATRLLVNYPLLARQALGSTRVALWGHGITVTSQRPSSAGYPLKRWVSRRPHWWFAYTGGSADIVRGFGYPAERITTVDNAIDTGSLVAERQRLMSEAAQSGAADLSDGAVEGPAGRPSPPAVGALRDRLGLRGDAVCLFVGAMHRTRRLEFLVEACDRLRELIPDFELVALGDGPEAHVLDSAAIRRPWLHRVGPVFGPARVPYFLAGKLILMPGAVGLAVLDSFALGVPMVATDVPTNGPEAAYIEHGRSGVVLAGGTSPRRYAEAVAGLLRDPPRLAAMRERCLSAADTYTVERMAGRFADGVVSALKAPPLRCPIVPRRRGLRLRRATRER